MEGREGLSRQQRAAGKRREEWTVRSCSHGFCFFMGQMETRKRRGSVTVHVRMPDKDVAALEHTAARLGLSKSDVVRRALFVALPCFEDIKSCTLEPLSWR